MSGSVTIRWAGMYTCVVLGSEENSNPDDDIMIG